MPGQPAAKQGDSVVGADTHIILVPAPPGPPVPTPIPGHVFNGIINGNLSSNVKIMGMAAATLGSTADNTPPHVPLAPGPFQIPPQNKATITQGSTTVMINGKPAARAGDPALTCDDMVPAPHGTVLAMGTVLIG
jgi:uncharacterized Zn-binding protein involved in type VI secretion